MGEERLLERIRSREAGRGRGEREDPRRAADSVLSHLRCILNTRQGNVPIAPDYGLPDTSEFLLSGAESVRDLERAIRSTIQKYEPRLKGVRVSFVPGEEDTPVLRFHVAGRLDSDPRRQVTFETVLDTSGRIEVRT